MSLINTIAVTAAVLGAAYASTLATISHGTSASSRPAYLAALIVLLAVIPPLHFGRLNINAAAKQLLVVAWRLAILLPSAALAAKMDGEARKCFLVALLACYFISLPLESWLLIRDVRRQQDSES